MDTALTDMHCHLDFLPDPVAFAQAAGQKGLAFFSNTVTPAGYEGCVEALGACPNVRVGVGLHPWWIDDGSCGEDDVQRVCQLVATTRYVGEVGLDFGKRHRGSADAQLAAFRRIMQACAREGGKLVSIHAVKSADAVLDVLEETGCLAGNQVVMHWFSGSDVALRRAIACGCWFSVGPRMLATKRGVEYVRLLPQDRVLLETDLPAEPGVEPDLAAWSGELAGALAGIQAIRGCDMASVVEDSSRMLLCR